MTPLAPALQPFPWGDFLAQWGLLVLLAVGVLAAWHGLRGGRK